MGMYSSGGGQSTTTTQVNYTPEERWMRSEVMGLAKDAMRYNMGDGTDPSKPGNWWQYTGPRPTAPSQATSNSWQLGKTAANAVQQGTNQAQTANNFGLANALYANSNPYLAGHIDAAVRPVVDAFRNAGGTMSTIRNGSVANGTFGGSRQGIAEGLAQQGLMRQVGDISSSMQSEAYTKGLDVQQNAIKNQAMLNMMQMMPSQIMSQIGQQQEGFSQANENYAANVRNQQKNGMWEPLQNMANLINGASAQAGTSTTSSVPKQDMTGQVLGGLGSMALMAFMMSDRRLKSHIVKLGQHAKGFGIYLYKIFGGWQIGVLAQEVQKVLPDAVAVHPSGYLMVNYSKLEA